MPEHPISLILPVLVIGTSIAASITRMTRSSVLEVMRSDYVLTAYAKGLSTTQVVIKHILKKCHYSNCNVSWSSSGRVTRRFSSDGTSI